MLSAHHIIYTAEDCQIMHSISGSGGSPGESLTKTELFRRDRCMHNAQRTFIYSTRAIPGNSASWHIIRYSVRYIFHSLPNKKNAFSNKYVSLVQRSTNSSASESVQIVNCILFIWNKFYRCDNLYIWLYLNDDSFSNVAKFISETTMNFLPIFIVALSISFIEVWLRDLSSRIYHRLFFQHLNLPSITTGAVYT